MGCAQATGGKGFILCLCGAIPAPLLCGNLLCHCPSNWTEHLLIHRIQSHTNPKRRKGFLKQAGQKSFKKELPKQRKGPKRAVKCRLKVPTHIWDHGAGRSNRPTRTILSEKPPQRAAFLRNLAFPRPWHDPAMAADDTAPFGPDCFPHRSGHGCHCFLIVCGVASKFHRYLPGRHVGPK